MGYSGRNFGFRRPEAKAVVWGVVLAAGLALLAAGIATWMSAGEETHFSAIAIGLGLFASIIAGFLAFAYYKTAKEVEAMRRGVGVVARWTVPPASFDLFRTSEAEYARQGYPGGYRVPATTPPEGVEVIFGEDCAIVGDSYFGLPVRGMSKIRSVGFVAGSVPRCLGFETRITTLTPMLNSKIISESGMLRIPISPLAEAEARKVFHHFTALLEGRVVARVGGWRTRMGCGWGIAGGSLVLAAIGIAMYNFEIGGDWGPGLAIAGIMGALGGIIIGIQGWVMSGPPNRSR